MSCKKYQKSKGFAENAQIYATSVEAKINPINKQYPDGTNFNKWALINNQTTDEKGNVTYAPSIRRWVIYPGGKKEFERYPSKIWFPLKHDKAELQKFVMRANGLDPNEVRARQKYELTEAYMGRDLMDDYIRELRNEIPKYKKVKSQLRLLERYFFRFFVQKMGLTEPLDWHRNQDFWGMALINLPNPPGRDDFDPKFKEEWRLLTDGDSRSPKTLKAIVQAANRFVRFLHKRRPGEVPPLEFDPLKVARLKTIEANRVREGKNTVRYLIPDNHFAEILKHCPVSIKRYVLLVQKYGLRRAEAMAIQKENFSKAGLHVKEQLTGLPSPDKPIYDILKGKDLRKVPHSTHSDEIRAIMAVGSSHMHPDTFTKVWDKLMTKLGFPYSIHCIRHTWITKAVRLAGVHVRDVQQAAGHRHVTTTLAYLHRDDAQNDEGGSFFDEED